MTMMSKAASTSFVLSLIMMAPCASAFFQSTAPFTSLGRSTLMTNDKSNGNSNPSSTLIYAKKKGKKSTRGKGFSKNAPSPAPRPSSTPEQEAQALFQQTTMESQQDQQPNGLSSIEGATNFNKPQLDINPDLPTEDRTKEILKQQYGLRTFEEQQGDIKAAQAIAENSKRMSKIKQMSDEEFDIFMVIPPPIIKGIDLFLKTGLAVTTVGFILAGVGITAEAWAVATNNKAFLPENVDDFIVNVIEPNFTYGLLVLLGFSISLGIFATAQLGSGSSVYKEEP